MTDLITSENYLCGAGLLDGKTAKELTGMLEPDDFSMEINRNIFEAFCKLDADGQEIDAAKVANFGINREYLFELMQVTPVRTDIAAHVAVVKKASMRRAL